MCDFVIIDIMENLTPDQMIARAIKIINTNETLNLYHMNTSSGLII